MAVVIGTNVGFVTATPTGDPTPSFNTTADDRSLAVKDTSPATAATITEIGQYQPNAGAQTDMEVGIYTDAGNDEPELILVGKGTGTNSVGEGWKTISGLNITISPNTVYWIAVQLDNTSSTLNGQETSGYTGSAGNSSSSSLPAN